MFRLIQQSNTEKKMEANSTIDWVLGGVALFILIAGMVMLLSGVKEMNEDNDP
jgi:hypothetical protein